MTGSSTIWRSAVALTLVAIMGTGLLAVVNELTKERIAEQERQLLLQRLGQIIPAEYDENLLEDRIEFANERHFPGQQIVTAWRARQQGQPVALVLRFAANNGYNGRINLLAGINYDGSLRGVRVISHRETPGLGDAIELRIDPWVLSFDGKRIGNPPIERWAVKRDGGDFDQFSGATITPRAVVDAVKRALVYFEANRDSLFSTPADTTSESMP